MTPSNPQSVPDIEALKELERPLSRDEIAAVVRHVPFFLLADDEVSMGRLAHRIIQRSRGGVGSVLLDSPLPESFSRLEELDETSTPLIFCRDGTEARQALEIICEKQLNSGILALDQCMGGPTGASLFREYKDQLPSGLTRVLQSSALPDDIEKSVEEGMLDLSTDKFSPVTFPLMLKAYLKKTFK